MKKVREAARDYAVGQRATGETGSLNEEGRESDKPFQDEGGHLHLDLLLQTLRDRLCWPHPLSPTCMGSSILSPPIIFISEFQSSISFADISL